MTDEIVCPIHGGAIRRQDGSWLCCFQEEWAVFPQTPPPTEPHPPPPGLRDQVAASLHQTRERSGIGNGATPGGATTSEGTSDVG